MKELKITELSNVYGGGLMYDIGYEIGSGLGGEWGKSLGGWLYDTLN